MHYDFLSLAHRNVQGFVVLFIIKIKIEIPETLDSGISIFKKNDISTFLLLVSREVTSILTREEFNALFSAVDGLLRKNFLFYSKIFPNIKNKVNKKRSQ